MRNPDWRAGITSVIDQYLQSKLYKSRIKLLGKTRAVQETMAHYQAKKSSVDFPERVDFALELLSKRTGVKLV